MRNNPSHPYPHRDSLMLAAERLANAVSWRANSPAVHRYINRKFRFLAVHAEWRAKP